MTCVGATLNHTEHPDAQYDYGYDRSELEAIGRGEEAMDELTGRRTWDKWVEIGMALEVGRKIAIRESNADKGKGYSTAFNRWLKRHPKFEHIDPAARKRLADCMKELQDIDAWHSRLKTKEQIRLNHPDTVLRHYRAWQREERERKASEEGYEPPPKKKSHVAELKEIIAEQQAKLDRREQGEGNNFTSQTSVQEFLDMVIQTWSEPQAKEIMKGWVKLLYLGASLRIDMRESKKKKTPAGE
jgi:hypothetical protein